MDEINDIDKVVKQQDIKIKELQDKVELLQDIVAHLIVCKQSNNNYPYNEFILNYGITPEQQSKIFLY